MKTVFGEVGVEEDVLGVDQVEVFFLEGGGNGGETGLVKIDLETISKLVSQLVRKSFLSTASLFHILISRPQYVQSQLAPTNVSRCLFEILSHVLQLSCSCPQSCLEAA